MNVPTHYNAMSDYELLRDLYARAYYNDPLLEYVCQRWELLVDGEKDRQIEMDKLTAEKEGAEIRADALQMEVTELESQLTDQEKETARWGAKADELQKEVEHLSAQLDVCDPFGKMRE
jgi:peptidoglycan hydrolase CwlO-like protein